MRVWRRCWQAVTVVVAALSVITALYAYEVFRDVPAAEVSAAGRPYVWPHGVPVGITLSGLQSYVMSPRIITTMESQTWAARWDWHANTVRFQILQDRLVGARGTTYARYYMHDIRAVTDYALHLGLTVVLNAQTEISTGFAHDEPLPTPATSAFWFHVMHFYKNNPRVVFDLFNEPRNCTWGQWQTAFQGLVDYIRRQGATNQLWVEGRWWGSTFEGAPLLRGSNIVYSFHHPGAPWPWDAPMTYTTWNDAFGYLAARGIPVVDGEFGNYVGSYYWGEPSIQVRRPGLMVQGYLNYLTTHHIGMLAWSLIPGSLNRTLSYTSVSREPQGDGALVHAWFTKMAHLRSGVWEGRLGHLAYG